MATPMKRVALWLVRVVWVALWGAPWLPWTPPVLLVRIAVCGFPLVFLTIAEFLLRTDLRATEEVGKQFRDLEATLARREELVIRLMVRQELVQYFKAVKEELGHQPDLDLPS